jgi:hypothetical protein
MAADTSHHRASAKEIIAQAPRVKNDFADFADIARSDFAFTRSLAGTRIKRQRPLGMPMRPERLFLKNPGALRAELDRSTPYPASSAQSAKSLFPRLGRDDASAMMDPRRSPHVNQFSSH